jgi:hypothetical protein
MADNGGVTLLHKMRDNPIDCDGDEDEGRPNYKPAPLKPLFLMALGVYLCALITTLEFGFGRLPQSNVGASVPHGKSTQAFISGPLITKHHQVAASTHRPLATAQTTPTRDLTARNVPHRHQKPPRWISGNETNIETGGLAWLTSSLGSAPSANPQLNSSAIVYFAGGGARL